MFLFNAQQFSEPILQRLEPRLRSPTSSESTRSNLECRRRDGILNVLTGIGAGKGFVDIRNCDQPRLSCLAEVLEP